MIKIENNLDFFYQVTLTAASRLCLASLCAASQILEARHDNLIKEI